MESFIDNYLSRTYGGKKALGLAVWHFSRSCLGTLDPYKRIDWQRVSRVIFVCKGNICRSAFAGRRFRTFGIKVASAGLEAAAGKPADPQAVKVARRFGTDLCGHRSTPVAELQLADGDLFVAFEPEHGDRLRQFSAHQPGVQVTLLGLWSPLPGMVYLHDPYGLHEAYFELCFARIERGLEGLRTRLTMVRAALGTTV